MTERVRVDLEARGYDVVVGPGALDELGSVLGSRRRVAIVTQPDIAARKGDHVRTPLRRAAIDHEVFAIAEGEDAKSLATVEELSRQFAQWGLLRADAVVAFGGGVVGDTAGFAASVYYRGVDVVQVPTTLLAMVDAAVGGKTGVNLPEGKNLVGAFHQPLAVLIDPSLLDSLPDREFRSGLGEVVKYALLGDRALAAILEEQPAALVARDRTVLTDVITRCVAAKAAVVAADEYERTGRRASLNLGHTAGHAIERAANYTLAHGEAVAVGLVFAMHLASALERIPPSEVDRAERLVRALGLPLTVPSGLQVDELLALMVRDKKSSGPLTFVLPGPHGVERVDDPDRAAIDKAFAAIGVTN
jgi:5-deoxy-5-amino-3-dehydroquinate synthase